MMKGGCMCKRIRYDISAEPMGVFLCHCRECQYVSGGGPASFLIVPKANVKIDGAPAGYDSTSDKGNPVRRLFCATCGTSLFSEPSSLPEMLVVKLGGLDDSSKLKIGATLWTSSAPPWAHIDKEIPSFEKDPT